MASRSTSPRRGAARAPGLGAPPSPLIGRGRELEKIARAVEGARLVTIVGSAGVGKTRLALELALTHAPRAGAWRVDLVSVKDAAGVCAAVEAALELGAARERSTAIGKAIAALGPALFVVDSFEHLVGAAAETLGVWLGLAPDARFVVTSQQPLRVAAEHLFELGPLTVPGADGDLANSSAAELFVERARREGAPIELDPGSRALVAEIVTRVDGLPLAIELAAARVRALSLRAVARELERGNEVLAGGLRDAPPRHASLDAAIASSWSLLSAPERHAAMQLSVFDAEFTIDSATAVLDLGSGPQGAPLFDLLSKMAEKSLLLTIHRPGRDEEVRFRFHAVVRNYARARLGESGQSSDAERRHAGYFASVARALVGGAPETESVDGALADFERAYRWTKGAGDDAAGASALLSLAMAVAGSLGRRGRFADAADVLEGAVETATRARIESVELAIALLGRARAMVSTGRGAEASPEIRRAAELCDRYPTPAARAALTSALGDVAFREGRLDAARGLLEEAIGAHRALGHRDAELSDRLALAAVDFAKGAAAAALADVEEAGVVARGAVGARARAEATLGRAVMLHELGDRDGARPLLEEALATAGATNDVGITAGALTGLARIHLEASQPSEARPLLVRALSTARSARDRRGAAAALLHLGLSGELEGRLVDAAADYREAAAASAEAGDLAGEGLALLALARAEAARDDAERGGALIDDGRRRVHASGHVPLLPVCELCDATVAIIAARRLGPRGGGHLARCVERARALLQAGSETSLGADARIASTLLRRALEDVATANAPATGAAASAPAGLVVSSSGRWFQAPEGPRVSLEARRPLRFVLARLAEERELRPGSSLDVDALLTAGWPGERVLREAGANRVYAAIAELRRQGLHEIILRRDDGYLLDPKLSLTRHDDAATST